MIYLIKRPGGKIKFSVGEIFFAISEVGNFLHPLLEVVKSQILTKVREKSRRKWINFWIISDTFLLFTLVEKKIFIHQSCKKVVKECFNNFRFIPVHTRMEASKWSVKEGKASFWWRNLKIFGSSQPCSDSAILFVSEQGFQWV